MSLSGISIFRSLSTFWTCWLHLFPYRKSITLPCSRQNFKQIQSKLEFHSLIWFLDALCVCTALLWPLFKFRIRSPVCTWYCAKGFPCISWQTISPRVGGLWRSFSWLSDWSQVFQRAIPSEVLSLTWFHIPSSPKFGISTLLSQPLFWALPEPVLISSVGCHPKITFFQVKSELKRVASKSKQDLSWLGSGEEQPQSSAVCGCPWTRVCQKCSLRQKPRSGWSGWSTEGVTDVPRDVLE